MKDIFGAAAEHPDYVAAFSNALGTIWEFGARDTLTRYIQGKL